MKEKVMSFYEGMIRTSDEEIARYTRLVNQYSLLRLVTLLGGGFVFWQTFGFEKIWLTELVFFAVVVLFVWMVSRQSKFEKIKQFFIALKKVNENETDSIQAGKNIYSDGSEFAGDEHPYASDLDILGKASLFNLINRCSTFSGCSRLAEWLLSAAPNEEILRRQQAVKEIAGKIDWKMKFQATLLFANSDSAKNEISGLLRYFQTALVSRKKWLALYVRYLPLIHLCLVLGSVLYTPVLIAFFIPVLINAFLVLSHLKEINRTDMLIGKAGGTLSKYAEGFKMIEEEAWVSPFCTRLQDDLKTDARVKLSAEVRRLSVLLNRLSYRLNMFIGPVFSLLLAWEVRQLIALERWKTDNAGLVMKAFDVLANMEALLSISGVHINYPEWVFPEIRNDEHYTLAAKSIGHPLINEQSRVTNDFGLENQNKIDIITGSNMAGKSTFLRTLGINSVMALAGAPVCAKEMQITDMKIFTYMRIKDSLNESISTFRAELNRLQMLLNATEKKEKLYFLIDEMLRGTNSADKYRGSKAIIEKLISEGAVGIVATHDLLISELEAKYPDYIRNFYFDIHLNGTEMLFDYKIKQGACKTFNASLLLKQLGVEIDEASEP